MEDKIIEMAENLINVRRLKEELDDESYWIDKAAKETDFVPAEGDWIHIEVTLFKIEVSVHHKKYYGETKYWKNGVWTDDPFDSNYPLHEEMLATMKAIPDKEEPEMGTQEFFDQNECWDAIGGDWQG